jgi:hypothetical protein
MIGAAANAAPDGCTIAVFGDTSTNEGPYAARRAVDFILENRETWTKDFPNEGDAFPIEFLLHLGSVTYAPGGKGTLRDWRTHFSRLNGIMGWQVGNGWRDSPDQNNYWQQIRPQMRFVDWASVFTNSFFAGINQPKNDEGNAKVTFIGTWGNPDKTSSAFIFTCGSKAILSIHIGSDVSHTNNSAALQGARNRMNFLEGMPTIISSNSYTDGWCSFRTPDGAYIHSKLIKNYPQVFMVMSSQTGASCVKKDPTPDGGYLVESLFEPTWGGPREWLQFLTLDWRGEEGTPDVSTLAYTVYPFQMGSIYEHEWIIPKLTSLCRVPGSEPHCYSDYIELDVNKVPEARMFLNYLTALIVLIALRRRSRR